jgi:hypothetical protein
VLSYYCRYEKGDVMTEIVAEAEKENDEWLRTTALSRSLEFFKQMEIMADEESVVDVANTFFKFLKGE